MEPQHDGSSRIGFMMTLACWLIVLGMLTWLFSGWLDRNHNPNAQPVGQVNASGEREVTLQRNRQGHYVATGRINGEEVEFLLDTGATTVAVPESLAKKLNLVQGREVITSTANGVITTFATTLDRVELGPISLSGVRATINPYMDDEVLLGMSFLRDLHLSQSGDTMTLRQDPR